MKRFPIHLKTGPAYLGLALVASLLTGCSTDNHGDLLEYVAAVKARPAGHIPPLPEFEAYESYAYSSAAARDPFMPKGEATLMDAAEAGVGLRPDVNRNKEALEHFPLDGLEFVGILEKEGDAWAIIKAPDSLVHRVQVGNHMGENYGKVVRITETKIDIEEIIPDGLGGWIKRDAALAITE